MFDKLYYYATRIRKRSLDKSYTPDKAIIERTFVNTKAQKLVVIFPNWHDGGLLYSLLIKRLVKRGWSVLHYHFHPQILASDEEQVVKSFEYIQEKVATELDELLKSHHYSHIHLIGISLGNVSMAMVTDKFPKFDSTTLVLSGDDLAVDMWQGFMTQNLRKAFETGRIGITRLDKDWSGEVPKMYAKNFAGKKVTQIISLNDKVIRTRYQRIMEQALRNSGADLSVITTRLGHVLTIARFCLFGPIPS